MFFRQMRQRVTEKMHSNLVRLHSGRRMPFRAECVLRKAGVHGQCVPAFLMKSRLICICQPALRSTYHEMESFLDTGACDLTARQR